MINGKFQNNHLGFLDTGNSYFISTWDSLKAVALWGEGNHSISDHIILNKIRINSGKQWGAHKAIGE